MLARFQNLLSAQPSKVGEQAVNTDMVASTHTLCMVTKGNKAQTCAWYLMCMMCPVSPAFNDGCTNCQQTKYLLLVVFDK